MSAFREYMAKLREKSGKSLREVAAEAGVTESAVFRCERANQPSVRGGSLAAMLTYAYGLPAESSQHRKALSLWAEEKTGGRTVIGKDAEWASMAKRINRLSKQHLAVIRQLVENPSLILQVGGLIEEIERIAGKTAK